MIRSAARLLTVACVCATVPFLHHGHIIMFITDVRHRVVKSGDHRVRDAHIEQGASRLRLTFGDSATSYEVSVHRQTRSVDVALNLEGSAAENQRMQDALVATADNVRGKLGPNVELEPLPANRARLVRRRRLSDADWSPKRDLSAFFNLADMGMFLKAALVLIPFGSILLVVGYMLPGDEPGDML
jgi:hypothetical protein